MFIEKASLALFITLSCLMFLFTISWLGKHNQPMQEGIRSYVTSKPYTITYVRN